MARKGDNAPVPQTCPKIDNVISIITDIYRADEPITKGELQNIEKLMEEIRSANSTLREWGNEQYEIAEELEKDRNYYQDEYEKYQLEASDLRQEIKELERELSELEK